MIVDFLKVKVEMALILRGVNLTEIRTRLLNGEFKEIRLEEPKRFYESVTDLEGTITEIVTPSNKKIKFLTLPESKVCLWCRSEVHNNIGIPFGKLNYEDGILTINTFGSSCSFECSAALIRREEQEPIFKRNSLLQNSWTTLAYLYNLQFPGKTLKVAPDPFLLFHNDINEKRGSLSYLTPDPRLAICCNHRLYQFTNS